MGYVAHQNYAFVRLTMEHTPKILSLNGTYDDKP